MLRQFLFHPKTRIGCTITGWTCPKEQKLFFSTTRNNHNNHDTTTTSLRLYRILQRQCQDLLSSSNQKEWLLQPPLHPRDYGRARTFSSSETRNHQRNNIYRLFVTWNNNNRKHHDVQNDDDDDDESLEESDDPVLSLWYSLVTRQQETTEDDDHYSSSTAFSNSLWASANDLQDAIRHAFRIDKETPYVSSSTSSSSWNRLAIQAVRLFNEQESMMQRTSISVSHGVRVVATSRCIGTATATSGSMSSHGALIQPTVSPEIKRRFAYRIRIENLPDSTETVQLLGRTWHIHEEHPKGQPPEEPITVEAPNTGAVGHLPVLQPGQVFEYMSGCELETKSGSMDGCFHMAFVDKDTESAMVGDPVDTFEHNLGLFQMPVKPFPLRV